MSTVKRLAVCTFILGSFLAQVNTGAWSAETPINDRTIQRTPPRQPMQEKPQKSVSSDRVFRRPAVVDHSRVNRQKADEKIKQEQFLHPSLAFLTFLLPYAVNFHDVSILGSDVSTLFRKHPECRRIDSSLDDDFSARVACSKPELFQAEGSEVIFTYAKVNEVITGAILSFSSAARAAQVARQISSKIAQKQPSYTQTYTGYADAQSRFDSPMMSVSVQQAHNGYLVVVDTYHIKDFADSEVYAKTKLQTMDVGNLVVGSTKYEMLSERITTKTCEEVSYDPEGLTREFFGFCFEFPYEAHFQLDFDRDTRLLKNVVLSPIGTSTGNILEDALKERFELPKYCPRIRSDVTMASIKTHKARYAKQRSTRMTRRPASVYAGTCETPAVYASQMRFVFENRNLSNEKILADYELRKAAFVRDQAAEKAFESKSEPLKGFFD